MNPQFHIQIPRTGAAKCHVVVSGRKKYNISPGSIRLFSPCQYIQICLLSLVTQQYETNTMNNKKKRTLHHIGFAVYEVPPNMPRLTPQYVLDYSRM